ncbi:hypothetical protein BwSH20_11960 [Bradyrhizobium ottawaense]|nr:hypothetical protein SG09_57470 [Bradyrhizobium ottawaense]BBO12462.1 hypothetical protein TM102_39320 [Bradyrhizobium sp. TM102]GMO28497.1 hypothetical protein BwSF21_28460 [Bradyrhizobium ottawaense]GMO37537.1 hypothetical protein BwSH14_45550 [Bradyrhizobium ottawaense]GMO43770.1 hypothetical protein BwSF12_47780 [Bradyrhizobium ottawaense]
MEAYSDGTNDPNFEAGKRPARSPENASGARGAERKGSARRGRPRVALDLREKSASPSGGRFGASVPQPENTVSERSVVPSRHALTSSDSGFQKIALFCRWSVLAAVEAHPTGDF